MGKNQQERPDFFEGQYLGAQDLNALTDFFRTQHARHLLGGHTWGIAVGLRLIEKENEENPDQLDVFIEPGLAWDGFGRPIVVTEPAKLSISDFLKLETGLVTVWLRYNAVSTKKERYAYEVCDETDTFTRVCEGFLVEAGDKSLLEDHRDAVLIGGDTFEDAREAATYYSGESQLMCDASVPYQTFPEKYDNLKWLVPIGVVNWKRESGTSGLFEPIADTDNGPFLNRSRRRYIGLVAEGIHAADGIIRLRSRTVKNVEESCNDVICDEDMISDSDIDFSEAEKGKIEDLVWVEGNLRAEGDLKMFGTRLEFRTETGGIVDGPLYLKRNGDDLKVGLGTTESTDNRLVVGYEKEDDFDERFTVNNDGKTGVTVRADGPCCMSVNSDNSGTRRTLTIESNTQGCNIFSDENTSLYLRCQEGKARLSLMAPTAANHPDAVLIGEPSGKCLSFTNDTLSAADGGDASILYLQRTGGGLIVNADYDIPKRVAVTDSGAVGIGTSTPCAKVQIDAGSDARFADGAGYLVIGKESSLNLVFDDNEIMARNNGAKSTLHLQADGGQFVVHTNTGPATRFIVMDNGDVGIGVQSPCAKVQIDEGNDARFADGAGYLVIGKESSLNLVFDDNEIMARNNGAKSPLHLQADGGGFIVHTNTDASTRFIVTDNGDVGIGVESPCARVQIDGGNDAKFADGTGYLVIGKESSHNVVFDNNEIMARNNGAKSSLLLQTDGGDLKIHDNEAESTKVVVKDDGKVGIGEAQPQTKFHVKDSKNDNANNVSAHVALLENTSTGDSADVLALKVGMSNPGSGCNFITFFGGNNALGKIEGTSGGITISSGGADFAEWLPVINAEEQFKAGDIVSVIDGKVTRNTKSSHHLLVISERPAVAGNMPGEKEKHLYRKVAFLGQVPVNITGPVKSGDFIVPSGKSDGSGIAVSPEDLTTEYNGRIVGRAWASSAKEDLKTVNCFVGLDNAHAEVGILKEEVAALKKELALMGSARK